MVMYLKIISGNLDTATLFTQNGALNNKLDYQDAARIFHEDVTGILKTSLDRQEQDLKRFVGVVGDAIHKELVDKYEETQQKLEEANACVSIMDKCNYYFKYHDIEYRRLEVIE